MKVKDPICGMDVDVKEAKKKGLTATKDGKEHYFCNSNCKDKFLGVEEPAEPLPHLNKKENFKAMLPKLMKGEMV